MTANTAFRVTELDFDSIKTNLITYLQNQTIFKDYNFQGAGLDVLINLLALNTHYQAVYMNFVASEAFLDSAQLRASVLSRAKALGYTASSRKGAVAFANIIVTPPLGNTQTSLTMPAFTPFQSQAIQGINYQFCTTETLATTIANGSFVFANTALTQGIPLSSQFVVDSTNPSQTFQIPNANVDTTTLVVSIQQSISNSSLRIFTLADDITQITGNSQSYWIDADAQGLYNIYFGDDFIGKALDNGNIVNLTYLSTAGDPANQANSFTAMTPIGTFANVTVQPISPAVGGAEVEDIEQVRFRAPLAFTTQNRAVTTDDYNELLTKKYPFAQSINVWGGEENDPPIFGTVFISIQPKDGYAITTVEKANIISDIVANKSVVTVTPIIIDPDYLYFLFNTTVYYNPDLTNNSQTQLASLVRTTIQNYVTKNLNMFKSTFRQSILQTQVDKTEQSILSDNMSVFIQKRFQPTLNVAQNYALTFGVPLRHGELSDKMFSFPSFQISDSQGITRTAQIDEVNQSFTGVDSTDVVNPGQNYTKPPLVVYIGDGTGATGHAIIVNGRVSSIVQDTPGINYTICEVNLISQDGNGFGAQATAILSSQHGTLETFYFSNAGEKIIINSNAGTVDYLNGIVTLTNFDPISITKNESYPDGVMTINFKPDVTVIGPNQNRIMTLDANDPTSIVVNMQAEIS